MKKVVGLAVLVLMLCAAVSAQGFGPMGDPKGGGAAARIFGDFKPVVGAWAEYLMTTEGEEPATMRLAVVGKEGESFWYEMVMAAGDEGNVVMKMLVSGNPQDPQNVTRMIVKAGDEPAMEMPMMAPPGAETDATDELEGEFIEKGVETVTVPAGTFKANHIQYTQEDIVADTWVAEDVGPYGMVKTTTEGMEMVLTAYGADATSLITETPARFEMPKMSFPGTGRQ